MKLELMTIAVLAGAALTVATGTRGADTRQTLLATQVKAPTQTAFVEGEVRRVDRKAGTITLKHGPIPNLEMPSMAMVFQAKNPAMLDKVKAGDRIRFAAEKIGDQYTVTQIERVE